MSAAPTEPIAVIVGSTRPTRICPGIAAYAQRALDTQGPLRYRLVDLAEIDLPLLDEPLKAAQHEYAHDHTRAWSEAIAGFAGFVIVTPQYNWGYPAALKNALDYLYVEWHEKPVTTVTYGTRGGGKCADQLQGVFGGLHMRPLAVRVEVAIPAEQVDADWQLKDIGATMSPYREQLERVGREMAAALAPSAAVSG